MSEVIRVAMVALLRKLEWSRPDWTGTTTNLDPLHPSCPVCLRPETAYDGCDAYHTDGCELLALIRALQPDK